MERILITGGGGYVGVELLKKLISLKKSNDVKKIANSTYKDSAENVNIEDRKYNEAFNISGIYCFDMNFDYLQQDQELFALLELKKSLCSSFEFEIIVGDIRDKDKLQSVCTKNQINVIYHLCSFGMSGKEMLANEQMIYEINVQGTENVIAAASTKYNEIQDKISERSKLHENPSVKQPVRVLYLSTYNVIFGSSQIDNGDERMDYFPLEKHVDAYSKSKAIAEQKILEASNSESIKSIALRPAAIYGEREKRHLPRIMKNIEAGRFFFTIGDAMVDWVHVSNLVYALMDALIFISSNSNASIGKDQKKEQILPANNVYFISDGTPRKNFDFLRPLCSVLDKPFPKLNLSVSLMDKFAFLCEKSCLYTGKLFKWQPEPFICRAEVYKVGITHYFSIDKAKRDLGYKPKINSDEGMKRVCSFYSKLKESGELFDYLYPTENGIRFVVPALYWWILINAGMILLALAAYTKVNGYGNIVAYARVIGLFIFRSQANLDKLFKAAVVAHIIEARIALSACIYRHCSPSTTILYTFQTLILGYPSLKEILKQNKKGSPPKNTKK